MPLKTDLSNSPYFETSNPENKYYALGFKPGLSVQTRELNELQTIVRNQFEKFGEAIFEKGTIVKGCQFVFHENYPYVKITDTVISGFQTTVDSYFSLYVKNTDGLTGYITNTLDGFEGAETQKTLYVTYVNSGSNSATEHFSPSDELTIFSPNYPIYSIDVENGGFGFGHTDEIVHLQQMTVEVSSGTFSNGEYIVNPTTGANAQIIGISAVSGETDVFVLKLKPRNSDLANGSVNSAAWSFNVLDDIKNASNTVTAQVNFLWGSGLEAEILTNSVGKITGVLVTEVGSGYNYEPWVGVRSANNASGIAVLDLRPLNYYTKVSALSSSNAIGNGYAFGVTKGVIFQRGLFLDVDEQTVIVNNYSNSPNNVSVGFDTLEEIETYLTNPELLDNAFTEENYNAPGADRIKCSPTLYVVNTDIAQANNDFFALAEWNSGYAFQQNQTTAYSVIGDELARRTKETSGNFVLDQFLCTTDSVTNTAAEGLYYTAVIDPGTAYIDGYRIQTLSNFRLDIDKATDTKVANSQKVSIDYGSYIRVNNLGGVFQFSTGDTVDLYDTVANFVSNTSLVGTTPAAVGTKIGVARVRSMALESGYPGSAGTVYRLYLFDVKMNTGKSFGSVKSLFYNGTYKGVADTVRVYNALTNTYITVLNEAKKSTLVFKSGLTSIRNSNAANYTYRTIDQTTSFSNSGVLVKSIASSPNEFYPFSSSLTSGQLSDLYVAPIANTLYQYNDLTGTVSVNTDSAVVVGSSTTFLTDVVPGDYLYLYVNTSFNSIRQVASVTNNTYLTLKANCTFANTSATYKRCFPKAVPIPFGVRSGLTGNVDANGNILTLNLGITLEGTTSVNTALAVDIQRTDVTSTSKTVNRNRFVKIRCANSVATTRGPWCLGVSDAFRLRNVYIGTSTVNTNSINVTSDFVIETNQDLNYNDLSYLVRNSRSSLKLSSSDYLLVEFDHYSSTGGYYDTVSYLHTANATQIAALDATAVASLGSDACSWEVPEIHTKSGDYYDLLGCIDFRPAAVNTVATGSNTSTAPINPAYSLSFGNTADPSNDKKFPVPGSLFTGDLEAYMGRIDDIIIGHDGNVDVVKGTPNLDLLRRTEPNIPTTCLKLQIIDIPPYPNITRNVNQFVSNVVATRTINEVVSTTRIDNHTVKPIMTNGAIRNSQPRAYDMTKIGDLEARIEALEYYQAMTLLESDVTRRVIPSSVDGSLNRFKYGFFVDDFSTYRYSEIRNPQYSASIEAKDSDISIEVTNVPAKASNRLVPNRLVWPLKHALVQPKPESKAYNIVNQGTCTVEIPPCQIIEQDVTAAATANGEVFEYESVGFVQYRSPDFSLTRDFTASDYAGVCTIYYYFYLDPLITVYQNNVAIITSSSATPFTNNDIQYLNETPERRQFWSSLDRAVDHHSITNPYFFTKAANGYVQGAGKFSWNHVPSKGKNYRVEVKGFPANRTTYIALFQYMINYPVNASAVGRQIVEVCAGSTPTVFNGVMHANADASCTKVIQTYGSVTGERKQNSKALSITQELARPGQDVLTCQVTGLKPNTKHVFYVDGKTQSTTVRPAGGKFGDDVITDSSGKVTFDYVIPTSWYEIVKDLQLTSTGEPYIDNMKFDDKNLPPIFALLELKAINSYASKMVGFNDPNKISF